MATIYIDPDSATNGAGTEADPKNTWAGMTWTAGNTYLQKRGTVATEKIVITSNGNPGSPITIGAYGIGPNPMLYVPGETVGIGSVGYSNHTYEDIDIEGGTSACIYASGSSIRINRCRLHGGTYGVLVPEITVARLNITVTECEIYDISDSGIKNEHSLGTNLTNNNWNISRNIIYRCGAGVYLNASKNGNAYSNLSIIDNDISDCAAAGIFVRTYNATYPAMPTNPIKSLNVFRNRINGCGQVGIAVRGVGGDTPSFIRLNSVANCGIGSDPVTDTLGGIWTRECLNLWIEDNFVSDIYTPGIDGVGIFDDQNNDGVVIRRNIVRNCYGLNGDAISGSGISSFRAKNSEIYSNLIYGCKNGYVATGEKANTGGTAFHNNTVFKNGLWGLFIGRTDTPDDLSGMSVKNNIVLGNSIIDTLGNSKDIAVSGYASDIVMGNNCYGTSNIQAPSSAGTGNVTSDPQLTADYRMKPTSPLLQAGVHLGYMRDIEGKQRPNPPSIGAYDVATLRTPLA